MDNSTKKLLNGTIVYFIGNALTQIISLVLLRFVTGKITPEEYGIYNLVVTVSNLVIPFATLQINDAVFKFLIKAETQEEKIKYFTIAIYISFVSSILIIAGVFITNFFIIKLPHPELIALYMTFSAFFAIYHRVVRALGKSKIYVIGNIIKTIIFLTLEIVLIYAFNLGVEALFLSVILSIIICLVFLEINVKSFKLFRFDAFDYAIFKKMLKFSLPLIPNAVFWWLSSSINSVIISAKCGLDLNGIYTVANKFSSVLTIVTSVFALSWQESAISEYGSENFKKFFTSTFNLYTKGVFSVIAVMLPFMCIVFPIMLDSSYHDAIKYAPFLLVASGISAMAGFMAQIFTAKSENEKLLTTNLFGMIVNILLVLILVEKLGLWAAVIGTFISNVIILGSRIILSMKEFAKGISFIHILLTFTILAISIYGYFKFNLVLSIIWLILCISVVIFLNFDLIKNLLILLTKNIFKKRKSNE